MPNNFLALFNLFILYNLYKQLSKLNDNKILPINITFSHLSFLILINRLMIKLLYKYQVKSA
jgi:hypothetical protein